MSKRKDTIALPASTQFDAVAKKGIEPILGLRQFSYLTAKHKNEKLDGYYLLRDQDRTL